MTDARTRNIRRALIVRRHRATVTPTRKPWSAESRARARASAQARYDRERAAIGLEPIDYTLEHAGNPDHELDMVPDSLLGDA